MPHNVSCKNSDANQHHCADCYPACARIMKLQLRPLTRPHLNIYRQPAIIKGRLFDCLFRQSMLLRSVVGNEFPSDLGFA
jgi:hypothetical protein